MYTVFAFSYATMLFERPHNHEWWGRRESIIDWMCTESCDLFNSAFGSSLSCDNCSSGPSTWNYPFGAVITHFGCYWNSIWNVVITMLTVGYGDYSPFTPLGRIFVMLACILTYGILTLMVSLINVALTFTSGQSKV